MFSLLRDLRSLRLEIDLEAPPGAHSLAIRHVDAGSCNGCEHELTLVTSPHYDLQRFGLNIVASPRHADVLLVTGPVTTRMRQALLTAYEAMPEPRRVVALGNCALGCALLGVPEEMVGRVEDVLPVDLRIPGCPPHPRVIAEGLLRLLDGTTAWASSAQGAGSDRRCSANGGDSSEPGAQAEGVSDG
jgi:Ni,Fe-hydrogenase III small subunit